MQRLNTVWQIASAASRVRDIAQQAKTYYFPVPEPLTFYLRAEAAEVILTRWQRPMIEVRASLQGAFGWRIATDQDEAGVYVAAARRMVVGGFSSAKFDVYLPHNTHLVFNLQESSVMLRHINGLVEIPQAAADESLYILTDDS